MTTTLTKPRDHDVQAWPRAWLLGSAIVLTGLMAGFFYAYACSVMVGLARTDDRTFVATMQSINAAVRNAAFAPAFFGALALTSAAAVYAVRQRHTAARWVVAAAVLYAAAFVLTMAVAVPLNDRLAAAGPVDSVGDLAAVRLTYEDPWVTVNILRTVLSVAALGSLVVALRGRTGRQSAIHGGPTVLDRRPD